MIDMLSSKEKENWMLLYAETLCLTHNQLYYWSFEFHEQIKNRSTGSQGRVRMGRSSEAISATKLQNGNV